MEIVFVVRSNLLIFRSNTWKILVPSLEKTRPPPSGEPVKAMTEVTFL